MKRRDILISLAIIVGLLLACYFLFQQTGHVVIETPGAELRLQRAFFSQATFEASEDPVKLPARAYTPQSLTLTRQVGDDTWKLTSSGPWGNLAKIKVTPGKTTSLALGPPLRITPRVGVIGRKVSVGLRILGRSGERYSNIVLKNDKRVPAPRVKIVDREGNVLASGSFSYG
jgi:hypothetical protein